MEKVFLEAELACDSGGQSLLIGPGGSCRKKSIVVLPEEDVIHESLSSDTRVPILVEENAHPSIVRILRRSRCQDVMEIVVGALHKKDYNRVRIRATFETDF